MPIPLLGLASILGREYAYTKPTYKEQDDLLKVLSPQTYYTNQLINYLTDKFGVASSLPNAQNTIEQGSRVSYDNGPKGISQEEYDRQMAELSAKVNTPEGMARFENTMRDMEYGTIDPAFSRFVGPQELGSARDRAGEYNLPRALESMPVESNFTPMELEAIRSGMYGNAPEVGPQREEPFVMPGPGGDFMPQGNDKNNFDVQQEYEQYLRGGLTGYRR